MNCTNCTLDYLMDATAVNLALATNITRTLHNHPNTQEITDAQAANAEIIRAHRDKWSAGQECNHFVEADDSTTGRKRTFRINFGEQREIETQGKNFGADMLTSSHNENTTHGRAGARKPGRPFGSVNKSK